MNNQPTLAPGTSFSRPAPGLTIFLRLTLIMALALPGSALFGAKTSQSQIASLKTQLDTLQNALGNADASTAAALEAQISLILSNTNAEVNKLNSYIADLNRLVADANAEVPNLIPAPTIQPVTPAAPGSSGPITKTARQLKQEADATSDAAQKADLLAQAAETAVTEGNNADAASYAALSANIIATQSFATSNPAKAAEIAAKVAAVAANANVANADPKRAAEIAVKATFVVNVPAVKDNSALASQISAVTGSVNTITSNTTVTGNAANANLSTALNSASTNATQGNNITVTQTTSSSNTFTSGSTTTPQPLDTGIIVASRSS